MPDSTYLTSLDPSKLTRNGLGYTDGAGHQVVASTANSGQQGVDAMIGAPGDSTTGFAAFDPAHQGKGDQQALYGSGGEFKGMQTLQGSNFTVKDVATMVAQVAAMYFGLNGLLPGAAGLGNTAAASTLADSGLGAAAGGAGGASTGALDVMGNLSGRIPDALDSVPSIDSTYTVNGNYSLTSGTGPGTGLAGEGNAGQGLNMAGRTGEGMSIQGNAPNLTSMGGGQGLTVAEGQTIGDSGSFINDPVNRDMLTGANGTVGEQGVTSASHLTDLGDPNSPINGGSNPWPEPAPATPAAPGGGTPWWGSLFGAGGGTGVASALQTGAVLGSLLGGALAPKPKAQDPQTPSQPTVGAGGSANGNATGGASGSLAGVAGTLLTSKDTFGYGKSMLS